MSSTIQRTIAKQVTPPVNNTFLIQRALQKIKSDLIKQEVVENNNRLLLLKNNHQKMMSGQQQLETAAVFNSLLQKSASISSKNRSHNLGYEETFNIYK